MEPILSSFEGDTGMMEIVREFVADLSDRAAQLEDAHESGEFEQLESLSHQLKGAGGGYGFALITEEAAALEQSLRGGSDDVQIKGRLVRLCEVLRAAEVSEQV